MKKVWSLIWLNLNIKILQIKFLWFFKNSQKYLGSYEPKIAICFISSSISQIYAGLQLFETQVEISFPTVKLFFRKNFQVENYKRNENFWSETSNSRLMTWSLRDGEREKIIVFFQQIFLLQFLLALGYSSYFCSRISETYHRHSPLLSPPPSTYAKRRLKFET